MKLWLWQKSSAKNLSELLGKNYFINLCVLAKIKPTHSEYLILIVNTQKQNPNLLSYCKRRIQFKFQSPDDGSDLLFVTQLCFLDLWWFLMVLINNSLIVIVIITKSRIQTYFSVFNQKLQNFFQNGGDAKTFFFKWVLFSNWFSRTWSSGNKSSPGVAHMRPSEYQT